VVYGEKLNSKQTVSVGLNNIGELFLDIGEPDSALYYVQKSLQIENTLFNKTSFKKILFGLFIFRTGRKGF